MPKSPAFIAIGPSGSVVVVRIMKSSEIGRLYRGDDIVLAVNRLISSNDARELLFAIDPLPPVIPCEQIDSLSLTRSFRIDQFDCKSYLECDAETLSYQAFFDAGGSSESESRARGTNWAVKNRNLICEGKTSELFSAQLASADRELDRIVVEELDDWCLARNLIGFTARLLALWSSGADDILDAAKMSLRENKRLGRKVYMIQFAFNPFFVAWRLNRRSILAHLSDKGFRPLTMLLFGPVRKEDVSFSKGSRNYFIDFNSDGDVFMVTDPIAREEYHPIFLRRSEIGQEERRYWLCADAGRDRTQREIARRIIESIIDRISGLEVDGVSRGWVLDRDVVFSDCPTPVFKPLSLLAQMLQTVVYRGEKKLVICAECGNAIIDLGEGRPRQFCSEACRQRAIRKEKKAIAAAQQGESGQS